LIGSTRLDKWFAPSSRQAQGTLPHVIRQLIRATVPFDKLAALRIPVHDEINRSGFDGVVEATARNSFVPEGRSVWEMGVGDPAVKATKDYKDRTGQTSAADRARSVFVFVTPHHWAGKDGWIKTRAAHAEWAGVRVVDVVDLAHWLELSPAVSRWLAR